MSALVLVGATITILLLGKPKAEDGLAPNGSIIPLLSQPEAILYQNEFFTITAQDLYEEFKSNDGVNQLLFMIDSEILKTRIQAVTQTEIEDRIKVLKYGTKVQSEIDEIAAEDKTTLEQNYLENMFLLGYSQDESVYVRLLLAKEQLATEMITNSANSEKSWYLSDQVIANEYTTNEYNDIYAIKIRFFNANDARQIMRQFNLVTYQNDLRLYIGSRPLEEVSSSGLNETNTRVLTNAEVLSYYLQMYQVVYGSYRDAIASDASLDTLKQRDDFKQNFAQAKATNTALANYMFNVLTGYENPEAGKGMYSIQPLPYSGSNDSAHYMVFKLTNMEKVDLTNYNPLTQNLATLIGQEKFDELKQKKINQYLQTTNFVAERMNEYRAAQGFQILDYYLGMDYKGIYAEYEVKNEGSKTLIARLANDFTISADQLLTFAIEKNVALYSVYTAQLKMMVNRHFENAYCPTTKPCSLDLVNNQVEGITKHYQELAELKKSYQESYYAIYYTFEEYVYLAYGAKNEADILMTYFIKSKLQPHMIYEVIKENDYQLIEDVLYDIMEEYFNNYFSLNAKTLLIFVDRNEDGQPDNYEAFLEELSDPTAHNQLIADFVSAIRTYLSENNSTGFEGVATAYNIARRTDPIWGVFKQAGLGINLGNPSSQGSLTYLNTKDQFEDGLVEAFQQAYQQYLLPANIDKLGIFYSGEATTTAGVYLLYAQKGSNFTKPTAKFTMTYTGETPNYSIGSENANDLPTLAQLKLYAQKRFYEIAYGTEPADLAQAGVTMPVLPTSLIQALDTYFASIHDALYVVGHLNLRVAELLPNGTFQNTTTVYGSIDDTLIKSQLAMIQTIFEKQVFAKFNLSE